MISPKEIEHLYNLSKDNPKLRKDLLNLNCHSYWLDKYYLFEDMLMDEFGELYSVYTPWHIDMHCYRLYSLASASGEKTSITSALAAIHKQSILSDMKAIEEYLTWNVDGFFGKDYE